VVEPDNPMRLKRWLAHEVQSENRGADLRTNPGRKVPESLTRWLPAIDGAEAELLSLGIIIVVALGYWLEYYALAFWVLCYAVGNGALAGVWAALNPAWYAHGRAEAGIDLFSIFPGENKGLVSYLVTKAMTVGILLPFAWHVGVRAGYFSN
jgi:hypothetical protein